MLELEREEDLEMVVKTSWDGPCEPAQQWGGTWRDAATKVAMEEADANTKAAEADYNVGWKV